MKSPERLLAALRAAAPSCAVEVSWSKDRDARFPIDLVKQGMDPDDYECWDFDVKVLAVVEGELLSGEASLGDCWQEFGKHPDQHDPDCHGYLPQKLQEAFEDLQRQVTQEWHDECAAAIELLGKEMRQRYKEQQDDKGTED